MDDIQRVKVPELPLVEDIKKLTIFGVEGPAGRAVRAPVSKIFGEIERLGYLTSEEIERLGYLTSEEIERLGYLTSEEIERLGYLTSEEIGRLGYLTSEEYSPIDYPEI